MRAFAFIFGMIGLSTAASATDTINYKYDTRGRVIEVIRTGAVNNGVTAVDVSDKAGSRTLKQTTAPRHAATVIQSAFVLLFFGGRR